MMANETYRTHKKTGNFTIIENSLISDNSISWAAKGILIYLLSKPDGWKVYKSDIVKHSTNGIDSVKSIIKELRKAGYITLTRITDAKGRVQEWRYDVYDEALETPVEKYLTIQLAADDNNIAACWPEHFTQDASDNPQPAPEAEKPLLDKKDSNSASQSQKQGFHLWEDQQLENPPTSNKELSKTDKNNNQSIYHDEKIESCYLEKEFEEIVRTIKMNVDFETISTLGDYRNWLEEWVFLIADYFIQPSSSIVINSVAVPMAVVRDRMLRLTRDHFDNVKCRLNEINYPIQNMKKYIFSALYNSVTTLDDSIGNDLQCL